MIYLQLCFVTCCRLQHKSAARWNWKEGEVLLIHHRAKAAYQLNAEVAEDERVSQRLSCERQKKRLACCEVVAKEGETVTVRYYPAKKTRLL
jgi:hypothetical protein